MSTLTDKEIDSKMLELETKYYLDILREKGIPEKEIMIRRLEVADAKVMAAMDMPEWVMRETLKRIDEGKK